MQRRAFLIGLTAMTLGRAERGLATEDPAQAMIARLRTEGFRDITAARTLIGRIRINASKRGATREVVIDPRTGEILRDLTRATRADGSGADDNASSGSGSGSGGSGSDDNGSGDNGSDDNGSDDSGSDGSGSDDSGSDDSGSGGSGSGDSGSDDSGSDDGGSDDGGSGDDD